MIGMPLHRQVFFIGGFDPKSPRFYHRLFREAAERRPASAAGERVVVGPRGPQAAHLDAWDVAWQPSDAPSLHTRYTVMRWDDIVRQHWSRHLAQVLKDYLCVYGLAGMQGMFTKIRRASPTAFWLAMFPLGLGLAVLLSSLVLAWAVSSATSMPWPVSTLGCVVAGVIGWRLLAARLDSEWLLRLYGFTWSQASGQLPELERRLDGFAEVLVAHARQADSQELLLVGHSTGAILAASVLARACKLAPWLGSQGPALSFLTLGHCMPILACLDQAEGFRDELCCLADHGTLAWMDVSAPTDWAAFASAPPWINKGAAQVLQVSPRFHQSLGAEAYQDLLADRHALHMQYLKAPLKPDSYDPIDLCAGPSLLRERIQRQTASPQ
jgi:hypothetical protein